MDSDEPQQPDVVGEPAGQQLKKAREKLGLSVKDVADAQHLRVSIIQAIEDGDYDQIASELFLKGYVRAYAKQVGADADALIQTLDAELAPLRQEKEKQELENPLVDIERRRHKKRQFAKAIFIILLLGGAGFAVWKLIVEPRISVEAEQPADTASQQMPESDTAGSVEDSGTSVNEEAPGVVEEDAQAEPESSVAEETTPSETSTSDLSDSSASETPSESDPSTDTEVLAIQSTEAQPASDLDNQPVADTTEPAGTESDAEPVEVAAVEPVAQADPVFAESAEPEAIAEQGQLSMAFEADCWVQVTDASGTRLVASLQRSGDQVNVIGRAPLTVVIGAVDAVGEVSFAGEPIRLSDYRVVNNRTEFTLSL